VIFRIAGDGGAGSRAGRDGAGAVVYLMPPRRRRVRRVQWLDDREVATILVLLAVGEPGENWRDERFGDVVVSNGVKRVREPRPFDLPATWEHEVPGEGLLQLHYCTSEKWVDRDLRSMLRARCLVGEEVNSASTEEEQR
jgi:hypothetical protein